MPALPQSALLLVSVGAPTAELQLLEKRLEKAFAPDLFQTACASGFIRQQLIKQGIRRPSPQEALTRLLALQPKALIVQPLFLTAGIEYQRLQEEIFPFTGRFSRLQLGCPLFDAPDDDRQMAAALSALYPPEPKGCLLLVGHGAEDIKGPYNRLNRLFLQMGRPDILTAALKGEPSFDEILPLLCQRGSSRICLAPLMLTAGRHACRDMAGGEDSWQARLSQAGFQVSAVLRGLAELPCTAELYLAHIRKAPLLQG